MFLSSILRWEDDLATPFGMTQSSTMVQRVKFSEDLLPSLWATLEHRVWAARYPVAAGDHIGGNRQGKEMWVLRA